MVQLAGYIEPLGHNNLAPNITPHCDGVYPGPRFDDDMLFGFNGSLQDSMMYE